MSIRKKIVSAILLMAMLFTLVIGSSTASANERKSQDLAGKVIILDAGHGAGSGGSVPGYTEHTRMLHLAGQIRPLLEARGATVHLTRPSSADVPLVSRAAHVNMLALQAVRKTYSDSENQAEIDRLINLMQGIINNPATEGPRLMNLPLNESREIHPDLKKVFEYLNNPVIADNYLFISLHSNALEHDFSMRGAIMFYVAPSEHRAVRTYYPNYPYVSHSRNLGNLLLNQISNVNHQGSRIPRHPTGLRVGNMLLNREVGIPSVLAENGFHTNASDRALLLSNDYMATLAVAYVNAIRLYFDPSAVPEGLTTRSTSSSSSSSTIPPYTGTDPVERFVYRLYVLTLNRRPEPSGFEYWTARIKGGGPATPVAHGFLFSPEMESRGLSDDEFVEILYETLLGRRSEPEGKAFWMNRLASGFTKLAIFNSFADSVEFAGICAEAGIQVR